MKNNHTKLFLLTSFFVLSSNITILQAQIDQSVSRAEYEALAKRVASLEARLNNQKDILVSEVLQIMPEKSEGQKSLISSVVDAVKQREQQVNFPWMNLSKWAPLRVGQNPEQVVAILGEPTLDEPSLNRRIDFVYTYEGRRPATNKKVIGKIRFYKGEAIEIVRPVID